MSSTENDMKQLEVESLDDLRVYETLTEAAMSNPYEDLLGESEEDKAYHAALIEALEDRDREIRRAFAVLHGAVATLEQLMAGEARRGEASLSDVAYDALEALTRLLGV